MLRISYARLLTSYLLILIALGRPPITPAMSHRTAVPRAAPGSQTATNNHRALLPLCSVLVLVCQSSSAPSSGPSASSLRAPAAASSTLVSDHRARCCKRLTLTAELYASGAIAGVANTAVAGPVENIRIRLQTQPADRKLYNGPLDCVRKLYAQAGLAGIFKGQVPTVWRDGVGYG